MMPRQVNVREIKKIGRLLEYPRPNLPAPAVLVTCCLIDWLARAYAGNDACAKFGKYIEAKMTKTFQQLLRNDSARKAQIAATNCSFKGHSPRRCVNSVEILYRHVRCGLVHDYCESADCYLLNRGNERYQNVIIDYQNKKLFQYALVLNAPPFVREFLATL